MTRVFSIVKLIQKLYSTVSYDCDSPYDCDLRTIWSAVRLWFVLRSHTRWSVIYSTMSFRESWLIFFCDQFIKNLHFTQFYDYKKCINTKYCPNLSEKIKFTYERWSIRWIRKISIISSTRYIYFKEKHRRNIMPKVISGAKHISIQ